MKIYLEKASGASKCRGLDCSKNPEYLTDKGRIKRGTTCVAITMGSAAGYNTSYYCRDCIDKIYEEIRKVLNPKLWIFH